MTETVNVSGIGRWRCLKAKKAFSSITASVSFWESHHEPVQTLSLKWQGKTGTTDFPA
jgi:hypothetical protein